MEYYLYLLQVFGGGNPRINETINIYGTAERAVKAILSGDVRAVPANRLKNLKTASLENSVRVLEYCKRNGISVITYDDKRYPVRLRNIYNPPTVLFVDGDISCLEERLSVSVVGPRKPDEYTARLGMNICGALAACSVVMVSGFAYGVDSMAHIEALKRNVPTIAVLACGMAVDYPKNSFENRKKIVAVGGAVVSELLPDTQCVPEYFRYRNRIISGLTYGTVVIGGYNTSGSLLTAQHAFEQDRDLFFTLPPDTLAQRYSSVVKYLRDGAKPVYDFYDIINEYYEAFKDKLDCSMLDKNKLSSFATLGEQEKSRTDKQKTVSALRSEITGSSSGISESRAASSDKPKEAPKAVSGSAKSKELHNKKKVPTELRFKVSVNSSDSPELDYTYITPENFLRKKSSVEIQPKVKSTMKKNRPVSEEVKSAADAETPSVENDFAPVSERAAVVLGVIKKENGASLDRLLTVTDIAFGELTEILTDMELDGVVKCGPGSIYTLV